MQNNFAETGRIKGVFTLGQDSKEAKEAIADLRAKNEQVSSQIASCANSKKQLEEDQQQLTAQIEESCWNVKLQYDKVFSEAFKGAVRSKSVFRERCLFEAQKPQTTLPDKETIQRTYNLAFGKLRSEHQTYPLIDTVALVSQETCDLLQRKTSGSSDTPIGKFIEFLSNSDWIRQGLAYASKTGRKCPFCQQEMSADIEGGLTRTAAYHERV